MPKGELPQYKALSPEYALDEMNKFIKEINSGEFKVVDFGSETEFEVLELPNPGGKPFTKPTGKTVKTLKVTICNQTTE